MKKKPAFLLFAFCLTLGSAYALQGDESTAPRTSLSEFKRLLKADAVIVVDVRSRESYLEGHIPGAISMPFDALAPHIKELKHAGKGIIAYCS